MKALTAIEKAKIRLLEIKQQAADRKQQQIQEINAATTHKIPSLHLQGWQIDHSVAWNKAQIQAINSGLAGTSFCLIGAAGTGKTTTLKGIISSLMLNNMIPPVSAGHGTKWLHAGTPGIVLTSFTNMAVRQIAKNFSKDVTCITIHKLLEFAPVYYESIDPVTGDTVRKMVFEPTRNKWNPLPAELTKIVIDEGSMVDVSLFKLVWDALPNPHAVQFIFLGDLNQLPPVFGGPILGKKLMELPIIELTEVYRQALLSPIIEYAIAMKDGKSIPILDKITKDGGEHGKVIIHPWSKAIGWEDALTKAANFAKAAIDNDVLDPARDIILCPYNVNFGVIELNSRIADYLGRKRDAKVIEVVAGFNTHYFAVGDKVLHQKREAIITKISPNHSYSGKRPINPDKYILDRWGGAKLRNSTGENGSASYLEKQLADHSDFDADAFLASMVSTEVVDRVRQASHQIVVRFIDSHLSREELAEQPEEDWETDTLTASGEINNMIFGYAITVHKSQGSEWRKVFIMTHQSHVKMTSRELMYTAITRAREELYIICEPDRGVRSGTLTNAAKKPRLKGTTLAEKLVSLKERFDKEEREQQAAKAKIEKELQAMQKQGVPVVQTSIEVSAKDEDAIDEEGDES